MADEDSELTDLDSELTDLDSGMPGHERTGEGQTDDLPGTNEQYMALQQPDLEKDGKPISRKTSEKARYVEPEEEVQPPDRTFCKFVLAGIGLVMIFGLGLIAIASIVLSSQTSASASAQRAAYEKRQEDEFDDFSAEMLAANSKTHFEEILLRYGYPLRFADILWPLLMNRQNGTSEQQPQITTSPSEDTDSPIETTDSPVETTDSTIETTDSTIETTDSTDGTTNSTDDTTNSTIGMTDSTFEVTDSTVGTTDSTIRTTATTVGTTTTTVRTTTTTVKTTEFIFDTKDYPIETTTTSRWGVPPGGFEDPGCSFFVGSNLRIYTMDSEGKTKLDTTTAITPGKMAYAQKQQKLVWADSHNRVMMDGRLVKALPRTQTIGGIAVETNPRNVIFLGIKKFGIMRMNFNGGNDGYIHKETQFEAPGVVISTKERFVYWVNSMTHAIHRCHYLAGHKKLITRFPRNIDPVGLTLDEKAGRLYMLSGLKAKLYSVSTKGEGFKIVSTGSSSFAGADIVFCDNALYYVDTKYGGGSVVRMQKSGSRVKFSKGNIRDIRSITVK